MLFGKEEEILQAGSLPLEEAKQDKEVVEGGHVPLDNGCDDDRTKKMEKSQMLLCSCVELKEMVEEICQGNVDRHKEVFPGRSEYQGEILDIER